MSRSSSSPLEQFFGLIFSALAILVAVGALLRRAYKAHRESIATKEAAEHDSHSN